MSTILTGLRNSYTTIGAFIAFLGSYIINAGLILPTTKEEGKAFIASLLWLLVGVPARDAGK